jgi:hypothetical protein
MALGNNITTIIHRLDNADFDTVLYHGFYVISPTNVVVNGSDLGTFPITTETINIIIKTITSDDDTQVYLLGSPLSWYSDGTNVRVAVETTLTAEDCSELLTESGLEIYQ